MTRITFGSRNLSKAIKKYGEDVIEEVKRIIAETAYIIVDQAKALAPVDDSSLKDSIEVTFSTSGLSAVINVGVHYGVYVEFGTGIHAKEGNGRQGGWSYYSEKLDRFVFTYGMEAQPFWMPAVDAGQRHFRKEMRKLGR